MRTVAESASSAIVHWVGTLRLPTFVESASSAIVHWVETLPLPAASDPAVYWFYHWLGTFNVSLAFTLSSMFLMALYMLYRCLCRMRFLAVLSLALQLALLTMLTLIVYEDVLVIPAYEMLFITFGVMLPLLFLLSDYAGMKRRVKVSCGTVPLVERVKKRPHAVVPDVDWTYAADAPGDLYTAQRVGRNLHSHDSSVIAKAWEQLREADELIIENLWDEADVIYAFLTRIIHFDAAGYCNAGWLKHCTGNQDEAVRLFRKALSVSKRSGDKATSSTRGQPAWFARFGIACACFSMNEYEVALSHFREASISGGDTAGLLRNMARCHFLLGSPEKAREEMERSLALEDSPETRLALARLFQQKSLREGVVEQLEHLTANVREMPAAWRMLGTLYHKEENWIKAEPCFVQLVRLEPEDADAWFRLGTCHWRLGNADAALSAFRTAIRLVPDHSRALFGAGAILEEKKEMKDAVSCLRQSLAGNEPMEKAYCLLAGIYRNEGRIAEAVSTYEEAVSKFPESGLLQASFGSALVMGGFHDRALKPFKKAIRLGENVPSIYESWVKALLENKHAHEAVRVSRDAMAAHPGDVGLIYLSARAKALCHDAEGAIGDLETVVAMNEEMRLEAFSCADFASIRTAPGFIDLIRLPMINTQP